MEIADESVIWTHLGIYLQWLVSSNSYFVPITDEKPLIPGLCIEEQSMNTNLQKGTKQTGRMEKRESGDRQVPLASLRIGIRSIYFVTINTFSNIKFRMKFYS